MALLVQLLVAQRDAVVLVLELDAHLLYLELLLADLVQEGLDLLVRLGQLLLRRLVLAQHLE